MAILDSLLTAILRADGDALVLHVGERPYVVTGIGNVDLAKTVLTVEGVSSMLAQLVPRDLLMTLSEVGAVEHQLQPPSTLRDAFTVVAARGGDDIWIEIRRKRAMVRTPAVPHVAEVPTGPEPGEAPERREVHTQPTHEAESAQDVPAAHDVSAAPVVPGVREAIEADAASPASDAAVLSLPPEVDEADEVSALAHISGSVSEPAGLSELMQPPAAEETLRSELSVSVGSEAAVQWDPTNEPAAIAWPEAENGPQPANEYQALAQTEPISQPEPVSEFRLFTEPEPVKKPEAPRAQEVAEVRQPSEVFQSPEALDHERTPAVPVDEIESPRPAEVANVVPLTRVVRVDSTPRSAAARDNLVERLLAAAAARSAEQIYLTSQSRPFFRVEGEMRAVENEPTFSSGDIDSIVIDLMPESVRESHGRGEPAEWTSEFEGVGRVRCATFRDHRGPGVVFHLSTTRPISAEQLGLPRDIQALATEPEGLLLVAGPRGGGKSTLIGAMVDLINRQHSVSVVTIERQIRIVHENRLALVSQREVRGTGDAMAVGRAALRENPDVLVLEDLKSPEIVQFAVDAAGTGRLVVLAVTAGSTVSALTRVVESFPPASRKAAQAALAERLRGAVSQVLLRKAGGGRIAARELLLPSHAIASLISDGQLAQLASAMDRGRKYGMVSLNDVLLTLVKNGSIDASEAYRKADNRAGLLAMLEHDGVDTSLLARLA